jgi:predicted kinase
MSHHIALAWCRTPPLSILKKMTAPRQPSRASAPARLEADTSRILQAVSGQTRSRLDGALVLVLTIGLPGSGKSTFARRLAPLIDAVVLESDALRALLFGHPSFSPAESRRLFAALHEAAARLLRTGRNVIVDATSLQASDRKPAVELARQTGARLLQLRLTAPEPVIVQRLAQRARTSVTAAGSSADISVYRRMAATAGPPGRDEWIIDTSSAAELEAALHRVVEACRDGSLVGGIR